MIECSCVGIQVQQSRLADAPSLSHNVVNHLGLGEGSKEIAFPFGIEVHVTRLPRLSDRS